MVLVAERVGQLSVLLPLSSNIKGLEGLFQIISKSEGLKDCF